MNPKSRPSTIFAACLLLLALTVVPPILSAAPADPAAHREKEQALIRTLSSDATSWQEKDLACRELQIIGTTACIPALGNLLADPDLSHSARCALEPMPYSEAGVALRHALAQTSGLLRAGIINSLAVRRDAAAVPALTALLHASEIGTAGSAAVALGAIGTREAADALAPLRATPTDGLRNAIAEGSLRAAERLREQGRNDVSAQICRDLQDAAWSPGVRQAAFAGLLAADAPNAVPNILAAMTDDEPQLRAAAIAHVAALPGDEVAERFAAELPRLDPEMQILLLGALQRRGDGGARDAVQALARRSGDEAVRRACAGTLGAVGDTSSLPWLADRASGANVAKSERDAALLALRAIHGPGVREALIDTMEDAAPDARPALIGLLSKRGEAGAVPALLKQAEAPEPAIRKAAFNALGNLAEPTELPSLLALLANAHGENPEAERAVARTANRIVGPNRAHSVIAALEAEPRPAVRASFLRTLGDIGGESSLAALEAGLQSEHSAESEAAVRGLASWPDSAAADALAGAYRATTEPAKRALALRGLVRVAALSPTLPVEKTVTLYRNAAESAQTPAERKLILSGVARVPHPDALGMAMAFVGDTAVQSEAALAATAVAELVLASHRDLATRAMKKLVAMDLDPTTTQQAGKLLALATAFEDYIMSWAFSGPYRAEGVSDADLLNTPFSPETDGTGAAAWHPLPPRSRTDQAWMLDLAGTIGGEHCVGYVRTWLHTESAMKAALRIGVDDSIKVWLNGELVHANAAAGAAVPDEENVPVSLQAGGNLLMMKIVQHTGPWEFCARLRTPNGGARPEVHADAPPHRDSDSQSAEAALDEPVPSDEATGWVALFNGKDLAGWSKTGDAIISVEEGCLVGTQTTGRGGDLWHDSEWDNFEMRVTYRVVWPANSGFWFRHDGSKGYQYDVLKWPNPVAFSGTLYCPGKMFLTANLNEALENRNDWNDARVRANGEELTLWLNGHRVGDCRDDTLAKGKIGIQVHGGDDFKNMRILVRRIDIRPL